MQSQNPFDVILDQLQKIENSISNLSLTNPKNEPEEDLTNINGAGKILNLAPGTIYNKLKEIPHFKKGKLLFFSKTALIDYIKEGKKFTAAELIEEVNETLHNLKNHNKNNSRPTQAERVKIFTATAEIAGETTEEAAEEAGEIHYFVNKDNFKKDSK